MQDSNPDEQWRTLSAKAYELRLKALEMVFAAGSGHLGGAFSAAEIITVLYYSVLQLRPNEPKWSERDRFVLSKGHAVALLYAALADRGFFSTTDLEQYRQFEGHLEGHPKIATPGIEVSTGPLGLGASVACGLAVAGKEFLHFDVYALLSDGELDEGIVWEAILLAAHRKLSNLTFIIDRNGLQYTGGTEEILSLEPLQDKFTAFGWDVEEVDGHDVAQLIHALGPRPDSSGPRAIIARTVKGKGVSFMEGQKDWHGKAPSASEYRAAVSELTQAIQKALD